MTIAFEIAAETQALLQSLPIHTPKLREIARTGFDPDRKGDLSAFAAVQAISVAHGQAARAAEADDADLDAINAAKDAINAHYKASLDKLCRSDEPLPQYARHERRMREFLKI